MRSIDWRRGGLRDTENVLINCPFFTLETATRDKNDNICSYKVIH